MDGFWKLRVQDPFSKGDAGALDLVHSLLRTLFIRHSKKQTVRATGRNILELPPLTHGVKCCPMNSTERALMSYVESLGVEAAKHFGVFEVVGGSEGSATSTQIAPWLGNLLRPSRIASWAPCLLPKGNLLRKIDLFIRAMRTVAIPDAPALMRGEIRLVSPKVAIEILQRAIAAKATEGFVNEQAKRSNWGGQRRVHTNATDDTVELEEIDSRIARLGDIVSKADAIPRLRWRWAILCVIRAAFMSTDDILTTADAEQLSQLQAHVEKVAPRITTRLTQRVELQVCLCLDVVHHQNMPMICPAYTPFDYHARVVTRVVVIRQATLMLAKLGGLLPKKRLLQPPSTKVCTRRSGPDLNGSCARRLD